MIVLHRRIAAEKRWLGEEPRRVHRVYLSRYGPQPNEPTSYSVCSPSVNQTQRETLAEAGLTAEHIAVSHALWLTYGAFFGHDPHDA